MKKTKRFLVTSAIVASLAMGTATATTNAQTTQAASILDQITSIFQNNGLSTAQTGTNVSNMSSITLPGGTTPTSDSIMLALGGQPTLMGFVPATATVSDDGTKVTFSADKDQLSGVFGLVSGLVPSKTLDIKYTSTITFANGTTTANVKKGDSSLKLDDSAIYNISQGSSLKVINNGGYNYAYAGVYSPTVQAVNSNTTLSSAETQLTVNVLDANFTNLNQTVIKGSNFDPNQITATDTAGQPLDITTNGNVDTSRVGQQQISITATDQSLDYKGNPIQWQTTATINVVDADSSQTINFQDANSGDIVDTQTLTGANGQTKSVTPPSGYTLVNDSDSQITLQKGNHASTVKVVKSGSSVETPFSGVISTYANGGVVPLYTSDGTQTSRSLSPNSDWQSDQTKTIGGNTYYRVSTNEWVKGSQVYAYTPLSSTITTNGSGTKALYSISGTKTSRGLGPNSAWFTDRSTTINGTQMYRVSTDEWVSASDVY
jgi:hypothetical protein